MRAKLMREFSVKDADIILTNATLCNIRFDYCESINRHLSLVNRFE